MLVDTGANISIGYVDDDVNVAQNFATNIRGVTPGLVKTFGIIHENFYFQKSINFPIHLVPNDFPDIIIQSKSQSTGQTNIAPLKAITNTCK